MTYKTQRTYLTRTLLSFLLTASVCIATEDYSDLWGKNGEKWNPDGLLRDFTEVGYKLGKEPIPDWPLWKNITEFGAIPNDKISDLDALKRAIAECPPYHAVGIPNGRFIIDDGFDVSANDIVIRGESRDGAILFFPRHLKEITPGYQRSFPSFIRFRGGSNRGLENLSLILRDEQKATGYVPPPPEIKKQRARHWYYSGENFVSFDSGEQDSWMRNVYLKNGNHVVIIRGQDTKQITLQNLVIDNFIHRKMPDEGTHGHMGIAVTGSQRCLIHNVIINGIYNHDLAPMGAKNCVFSRIRGPNIEIDHHANGNYGNLFTEIDTGIGDRGYGEGYNNEDETYWGIKGIKEKRITAPEHRNVFVGLSNTKPNDFGEKHWHENIDPDVLHPANLYLAQLKFKDLALPEDKVLTLPPHPKGIPVKLLAADDATTHVGNEAEKNFGNTFRVSIRNGSKANTTEGFFKFDVSELDQKSFANATLKLYAIRNKSGFPLRIEVVEDDTWTEATITGENQPSAVSEIQTLDIEGDGWHSIDLTAVLNQELLKGDSILSIKLSGQGKSRPLNLSSKEGYNVSHLVLHVDESTIPPPSAPSGVEITKGEDGLTLDWKDNPESDIHSYDVYRHDGDDRWKLEAMGLITSDYKDGVVEPGKTYTYKIIAVDTAGTESTPSEIVTGTF